MRVVVAFTPRGYHPQARASHDTVAGLERFDVSRSDYDYMALLLGLWAERESFLLIEHDVEVNEQALREARECECWWGISPYVGPGHGLLYHSLGFVRFRGELMERIPDAIKVVAGIKDSIDIAPGHWKRLDCRLEGALRNSELYGDYPPVEPHIHSPVVHHHVYDGRCSCGGDHTYPVDQEGRYYAASDV